MSICGGMVDYHSVWGSSPNDVFVVGDAGGPTNDILHYDGSSWTEVGCGTTNPLYKVLVIGLDDVFVVGEYGTILHYGGPPK